MRSSVFTAIRRALAIGLGVALPALLAGPAGAVAAGWPQYGHDPAHTFTAGDAGGIDTHTVGGLVPGWATWVPASETPSVAGGRVFVSGWVSTGPAVSALDAASGRRLWTRPMAGGDQSLPAVVRGRVFVCDDGRVSALGASDGHLLFQAAPCSGSVVVAGSRGFTVGSGGVLHAWSVLTGRGAWTSPAGLRLAMGSPVVADGRVYQPGSGRGAPTLFAFDTTGGGIVDRRSATPGFHFLSGASIVHGALWIREFQPCLECADIDGEIYVRAIRVAPRAAIRPRVLVSEFVNESSTPAAGFGHLFSTGVDAPGVVAYPLAAGSTGWNAALGSDAAAVTLAGGVVYPDQCGCALAAATGKLLWTLPNAWIESAPAIAAGVVYFSDERPDGTTLVRTFHLS